MTRRVRPLHGIDRLTMPHPPRLGTTDERLSLDRSFSQPFDEDEPAPEPWLHAEEAERRGSRCDAFSIIEHRRMANRFSRHTPA